MLDDSVPTGDPRTPEGAGVALPVCGKGNTLSTMVSFDPPAVDEAERPIPEASVPVGVAELMIPPGNGALANEAVALSDERVVINLPTSEDEPPSVIERFDRPWELDGIKEVLAMNSVNAGGDVPDDVATGDADTMAGMMEVPKTRDNSPVDDGIDTVAVGEPSLFVMFPNDCDAKVAVREAPGVDEKP